MDGWIMDDKQGRYSNAKSGVFDHSEAAKVCPQASSTMTDTRKCKSTCFRANLAFLGCPLLLQSVVDTFTGPVVIENTGFVVGISTLTVRVPAI